MEKHRILLVDDEASVLYSLRRFLQKKYDVRAAQSADEGLRLLENAGPFAVVIADLRMPIMDGASYLIRARSISPTTTRIMLTGEPTLESTLRAVNDGAVYRILTKPSFTDDMIAIVDQAVRHHERMSLSPEVTTRRLEEITAQLAEAETLSVIGTTAKVVGKDLDKMTARVEEVVHVLRGRLEDGESLEIEDLDRLAKSVSFLREIAAGLNAPDGKRRRDGASTLDLFSNLPSESA